MELETDAVTGSRGSRGSPCQGLIAPIPLPLDPFIVTIVIKTTPQFWMHMQGNFDLKVAMGRRRALTLAKRAAVGTLTRRGRQAASVR